MNGNSHTPLGIVWRGVWPPLTWFLDACSWGRRGALIFGGFVWTFFMYASLASLHFIPGTYHQRMFFHIQDNLLAVSFHFMLFAFLVFCFVKLFDALSGESFCFPSITGHLFIVEIHVGTIMIFFEVYPSSFRPLSIRPSSVCISVPVSSSN